MKVSYYRNSYDKSLKEIFELRTLNDEYVKAVKIYVDKIKTHYDDLASLRWKIFANQHEIQYFKDIISKLQNEKKFLKIKLILRNIKKPLRDLKQHQVCWMRLLELREALN